jgi:outer membrane protein assembly factor BamB
MKAQRRIGIVALLLSGIAASAAAGERTRIFDGKTFAGWEGSREWFRIEDGAIVGGSLKERIPRNEFLCTTKEYADFELRLKLKLVDDKGNAGIQIRSKRIPDHHEMIGYQADVSRAYWGALYDESRRRKMLAKPDRATLAKAVKAGKWNDYVIRCEGKRIQLWLNGVQTVDYTEPDPKIPQTGIIGLQIHGGPASEVWYKDIEIEELSSDAGQVQGGLVVHVGCGDGKVTATLRADDRFLVHGLDTDAANIAKAREHIRSLGLDGKVSVDTFDGKHLPYVDNLVNLLVAGELGGVTRKEVLRVLAPLGVAHIGGKKIVKPWPTDIDEWTHFLHGADNNAVAKDTVVGPARRYQWISGPKYARSHDHLNSVSAVVSARGRIFSIIDEAPVASVAFEPEWRLVARDAFSGVLLWKRKIGPWEGHFRPFRTGPTALARRLVADGDRVYVTLGYGKPVSILDAATGRTIRECSNTDNAMEIAVREGVLFAVVGDRPPYEREDTGRMATERKGTGKTSGNPERHWKVWREKAPLKHLVAVEAASGKLLWKKDDADTREILPTAMGVAGGRVFVQNEKAILALDAGSGKQLWQAKRLASVNRAGSSAPTLVAGKDVVICADREVGTAPRDKDEQGRSLSWYIYPHTDHPSKGQTIAYDAVTGRKLWSVNSVDNFRGPPDVFVLDDKAFIRSMKPGLAVGLDLRTGEKKHVPPASKIRNPATHWRCYRNKATQNYLILCQRSTEFHNLATGTMHVDGFLRGACQYGVMPCNGLLYVPHHPCACSIETYLTSFNALAPKANPTQDPSQAPRLEKGPAYGKVNPKSAIRNPQSEDWPTYRCDASRSGVAKTAVGAKLTTAWETKLTGRLTAPVVAGGLLITAAPENHTVHALDADSGKPVWRFATGGAVDSPPTLHKGAVIFGCTDGWITCLRAADGELIWRYRAAPIDRRIVAHGNVESVWPVHGSVLVQDGVVYAVAGRTTSMDGSFFYALDAATGRKLVEQRIEKSAFPDVLASDGTGIFMRQLRLDKQGAPLPAKAPHLFSSAGFLDDTWWHRTYWQYGMSMAGGYTRWFSAGERRPSGRLMVMDREKIYAFGRLNQYDHVGSHVGLGKMKYALYAANRSDFPAPQAPSRRGAKPKQTSARWDQKKPDIPTRWSSKIDLLARGMVLSGGILFLAGPPDLFGVAPGKAPHPYTLVSPEALRSQREALEGKKGTLLWAVDAASGRKLSEMKLPGLPAWDGLIAARGRLYLTMQDGTVRCLSGQHKEN